MSIQTEKQDVFFNTKAKIYPDGSYTEIRCSKKIFKSPYFESSASDSVEKLVSDSKRKNKMIYVDENGLYNIIDLKDHKKREVTEPRDDSLKRAKDSIFDIVYLNDWKYFLTITFDENIIDSHDVNSVIKPLKNWLENSVKRKGLQYVLIPEYHKKGGIHCHALTNDVFNVVDSGTRIVPHYSKPVKLETIRSKQICDKIGLSEDDLKIVYNVPEWRYGFSTAIETYGQPSQIAYYVTKYLTKDTKKIFGKFFWSSKNIVRKPVTEYYNSEFDDTRSVVSPHSANISYQYESCFKIPQQEFDGGAEILKILKENGLD